MELLLLAASPLILILILLLFVRMKMFTASIITLIYTSLLSFFYWRVLSSELLGAGLKGVLVGFDITLIIGGALLFIQYLKNTGRMSKLEKMLESISTDVRVQTVFLAWFLCSFLEGTAGFGVPAAVVAPLLVTLGIKPITAVAIALLGDTLAVSFGAVGTPIRIGFESLPIENVAFYTGLLNLVIAVVIPIAMLIILELSFKKRDWRKTRQLIPFATYCGLAFSIPFTLLSYFGNEYPSLVGSLIGMGLVFTTTKLGFLLPRSMKLTNRRKKISFDDVLTVIIPYVVFVFLLVYLKPLLPKFTFAVSQQISHSLSLYNPGIIFIVALLIVAIIKQEKWGVISAAKSVGQKLFYPFVSILSITAIVQIMVYSYANTSGLESMITIVASVLQNDALIHISPFIGAFGAFIAGSGTVSNLLFGELQAAAAVSIGYPVALILALQLTGAAMGNMISLTNIVAAQSTVGISGKEREILKLTILPTIGYLLLVGFCALILLQFI